MKSILQFAITFAFTLIVGVIIFPSSIFAETIVMGNISEDTLWTTENGPYIVDGPMYVDTGTTLTIDPGVVVKFSPGSGMLVSGKLDSVGTAENPIYFTSLNDDEHGGDTNADNADTIPSRGDWGVILFNDGSAGGNLVHTIVKYSDSGILVFNTNLDCNFLENDNQLILFESEGNIFSNSKLNTLQLFDYSTATLSGSRIDNYTEDSFVFLDNHSELVIDNTTFNSSQNLGTILSAFNNSSLEIKQSSIIGFGGSFSRSFSIFDSSSLYALDVSIKNVAYGVYSGSDSNIDAENISIECSRDGFIISNSKTKILESIINCSDNGINLFNSEASIDSTEVFGAQGIGIVSYDGTSDAKDVFIAKSEIHHNHFGISSYQSNTKVNNNSIHDNYVGAFAYDDVLGYLDFTKNWWGDVSGPYQVNDNPDGKGNEVLDYIYYLPWLRYDPVHPGPSSVLFIPGFNASRLYKQKHFPIIGNIEDKLWEPNTNSDVTDMYMDENGDSINPDIYTRDIVDTASVFGLGNTKIYDSFINDMNTMVASGIIADWEPAPYDWRLSPADIVDRGKIDSSGNILYSYDLEPDDESYIVRQVASLINSSKSGRVTLVTHSNGGLVGKALLVKLQKMKDLGQNNYIDYIDRVIMVAAPQVGTPKAIPALLHGYDQEIKQGLILKQSIARIFGSNLAGAYGLLPTEKYFYTVKDSPILFDKSLEKLNPFFNLHKTYGDSIAKFSVFIDFILGIGDNRKQPEIKDLNNPIILNNYIFNKIQDFHDDIDNYVFPESIKLYQIAGWGLSTVKNIRYFSQTDCVRVVAGRPCSIVRNINVEPNFTDDGDKTVVTPSAVYDQNGDSYFLNLYDYNKDFNLNGNNEFEHSKIFEIQYLRDFIKNTLLGINVLPDYFSKAKPKSKNNLVLKVHLSPGTKKNVQIVDKGGLKIGIDPVQTMSIDMNNFTAINSQIPGGGYSSMGQNYYFYLPRGGGSSYSLQINNIDPSVVPVVDSIDQVSDDSDNPTQISEGEIIIRVDDVNDSVIEDSVNTPPVSVGSGTSTTVIVPDEGIDLGPVLVDDDSDGVVDSSVPFVPTPDPDSPVQSDPRATEYVEVAISITSKYGSYPMASQSSLYNINSNLDDNKIENANLVSPVNNTTATEAFVDKSELNLDSTDTGDSDEKSSVVENTDNISHSILASAYFSGVKVSWSLILGIISSLLLISSLVYKVKNNVK